MTRIAVDLDQLMEFVARLEYAQTELTQARGDADARIRQVQTGWDGAAAQAQAAAHARWRAGARQVQEALAALHSIARTAHANYAAAVRANQSMWQTG
jgi:WXG100 family type VII secretion target